MKIHVVVTTILVLVFGAGCSEVNSPKRDFSHEVMSLALEPQSSAVYEQEVIKLKAFADSGNSIAQYRYADILLGKDAVDDAILYLQRSVALGEAHSAELLGFLYIKNESKIDDVEGFQLLTSAAKSGLNSSQFYLGTCFSGKECGLPGNVELSYYWLKKAYENGASGAKFMLDEVSEDISDKSLAMQNYDENVRKVICALDSSQC